MYIYAIGTTGRRQKIGYSADPEVRLRTLQTGNPEPLQVQYIFEIDEKYARKYEKFIHREYGHKRISGEWFDMTPEEVASLMQYQEIMLESTLHRL